jgi:hypothetical protein
MKVATDYLRRDFRPLDWNEKIGKVQDFFSDQHFTHFPVIDGMVFRGSLALNDVEILDEDKLVKDFGYVLSPFFCRENTHWLDALELFAQHDTNIIPVLDPENQYVGYYELNDMVRFLNETPFLSEPGNLLIIEKEFQSFSMSQIVQIIEGNNGKMLGLFVSETQGNLIQITIKLTLGGINEIIQSFRRYGYEIVSHHEEDNYLLGLKERSDYLKRYLDL